jgi:hypothetical protein
MTESKTKSLAEMAAEVAENNARHNWCDGEVPFATAVVNMHGEISEAWEAWRKWGLDDATHKQHGHDEADHAEFPVPFLCKPEGVGSEFADILIRWLDDAVRFGMSLEAHLRCAPYPAEESSFPEDMQALHDLTSLWSLAGKGVLGLGPAEDQFGGILAFLYQCCEKYGIDLQGEYERKMDYNRQRPYRHGGKRA